MVLFIGEAMRTFGLSLFWALLGFCAGMVLSLTGQVLFTLLTLFLFAKTKSRMQVYYDIGAIGGRIFPHFFFFVALWVTSWLSGTLMTYEAFFSGLLR